MRVKITEYGSSDSHYRSKDWPVGREVTVYAETLRIVDEEFVRFHSPEGYFAEVKVEEVQS